MTADFAALDALYPLSPAELSRQWALTRRAEVLPRSWPCLSLHGWHLAAHPDARVCWLQARNGEPLGWVIEPLAYLESDAGYLPGDRAIRLPIDGDSTFAEVEHALYGRDAQGSTNGSGFVGSWTAILLSKTGRLQHVYLGVTHSVVYSAEEQIVATTHNLVPGLTRDVELSRGFDPIATQKYYTFGLTPFIGLRRLLPNHRLDLSTFAGERHWPARGFHDRIPGPEAAARIVDHARRVLDLLAEGHSRFKIPLSAGRDSRAVLACLRPFANDKRVFLHMFTSSRASLASRTDAQIAVRLARIAKIPHRVVQVVPRAVELADVQRAFVRLGESKSGPVLAAPARETAPPPTDELNLPGMAGETARAFYWGGKRPTPADIEPLALARRTSSPPLEAVLNAAQEWLDNLPSEVRSSPCDTLDLAYIEQRIGCWESSSRYLFPGPGRANLSVMATALSLETMLRLPEDYRAEGLLQKDMVAYGWPELLPLPFNKPVGLLRLRRLGQQLRHLPERGLASVRRRLPWAKKASPL